MTHFKRLGFFSRLLDQAAPAERYRLATEQILHAERCGFDGVWVAQHHFLESEGGMPAPFVFLSHIAARTRTLRIGTGIVTLPLDHPVRVAEDAAVLDTLANGRLELGVGPGGTPSAFASFGAGQRPACRNIRAASSRAEGGLAGRSARARRQSALSASCRLSRAGLAGYLLRAGRPACRACRRRTAAVPHPTPAA